MTIRVADLVPGDELVTPPLGVGIVIAVVHPHPLYPGLSLVIWWLPMERPMHGGWSFDALSPLQELDGHLNTSDRETNLRHALQPGRRR